MQEARVFCARIFAIIGAPSPRWTSPSPAGKEELLVPQAQWPKIYVLRRIPNPMGPMD
jgi:hypothetical protein